MSHSIKAQSRLVLTSYARHRRPKKAAQEDEYTRQFNVMLRALQRIAKMSGIRHVAESVDIARKAIESVKKGWD